MIGPTELSLCSKQLKRLIPGVCDVGYKKERVAGQALIQVWMRFSDDRHDLTRYFDSDLQFLRGRILRVMEKAAKGVA